MPRECLAAPPPERAASRLPPSASLPGGAVGGILRRSSVAFALLVLVLGTSACPGPSPDPSTDAGRDAGTDAGSDAGNDAGLPPDSGSEDPEPDAGIEPLPPAVTLEADASSLVLRFSPGATFEFPVRVTRQSWFSGDVPLHVRNLPPHVQAPVVIVPAEEHVGTLVFTLDEFAIPGQYPVTIGEPFSEPGSTLELTLDLQPGPAALDSAFGTGGMVVPGLDLPEVSIHAMATQRDGKWVLVGSTGSSGLRDLLVVRLLPDGTLDAAFGTGGVIVTDVCGGDDSLDAVHVLSDGRILVGGSAVAGVENGCSNPYQGALFARYTSSGVPDTTFAGGGLRTLVLVHRDGSSTRAPAAIHALTVDPEGRVVGVGTAKNYDRDVLLVRLTPMGIPDSTFDGDGLAWTDLGAAEEGLGVIVRGDGTLIVLATTEKSNKDLLLLRYSATGRKQSPGEYFSRYVGALTPRTFRELENGKVLVGGTFVRPSDGQTKAFVARITSSGSDDSTFASTGYRWIQTGHSDVLVGMSLLPGGEVAAVTRSRDPSGHSAIGVVHLSPDGYVRRSHRTDLEGEELPQVALLDAEGFLRVAGTYTAPGNAAPEAFVTRFLPY